MLVAFGTTILFRETPTFVSLRNHWVTRMSREKFDDNCPDCRPILMDVDTGQRMPEDSPEMRVVLALWDETTLIEREAWHRVTCQNSQLSSDLRLTENFTKRIRQALVNLKK